MAKTQLDPEKELLARLEVLARSDGPIREQASGKNEGLFPSGAAGKVMLVHARERGLIESVPDPNAPPPKGKVAKTPKLTHARLTPAGQQWLIEKLSPKAALEALPALLAGITAAPAGGHDLSALSEKIDGLSAQVDTLRAAVQTELARRREPANDPRGLLAAVEAKVSEAVELTRTLSSTPVPVASPAGNTPTRPDGLAGDVVEAVTRWRRERHGGCPLDELYSQLAGGHPSLTPGRFHDALRELHRAGAITLTGWAKSLFELPRPELAFFVSDKVMFYASPADRSA